jgi:hypothetical protein
VDEKGVGTMRREGEEMRKLSGLQQGLFYTCPYKIGKNLRSIKSSGKGGGILAIPGSKRSPRA